LKEKKFIWLAFFIAAAIMTFVYILRGVFPFGENIILKVDLYHQYGPFHEELRSRILNGQSLFYSWEGGLGKEFITQLAYYTASPLSFLMLLFKQENMPEAMALFIVLKIAFCAGFFAYYLKQRFKRNDLSIVAFSLMYAFMAYVCGYYWNVMWLDAIALFPMVALGIERLVEQDRHILYGVSLTIVIITNFYIAFLVCVFSVLYFLVILLSNYSIKENKNIILKRCIKFAIVSLLAGGIAMFLAIPTAIALSYTTTSETGFPNTKFYENIYQIITNHFLGARLVVLGRNEDLPNIYSGIITMLLLPFYFLNKKINLKEKILYALLILFMIACSSINTLDYLIHGLHFPSNLPHRYTFVYSFILLTLAYRAFVNIRYIKLKHVFCVFVFYTLVILITEFILVPRISEIERVLSNTDIIINIVAMIIYMLLFNFYRNVSPAGKKPTLIVIVLCIIAEVCFSAYTGLDRTTSREKYVKYIHNTEDALSKMEDTENEFYRCEFRRFTTINDAALYHYKGFSQFSSLAYGATSELIQNLGIAATGNSYRYYDPTPLIDAMFNLKYIMNKNGAIREGKYDFISQFDNVWLYENKRYLSLGFMTNEDIKNWNTDLKNPFDVQNDFILKTTGIQEKMLDKIDVTDFNYTNLDITDENEDGVRKYSLTDAANLSLIPKVEINIPINTEQYVYFYVDAGNAKRVKYTVNGHTEDRELSAGRSLFDVGVVPAGTNIFVEFELTNKGEFEKTYRKDGNFKVFAASYNDDVFNRTFEQLSTQQLDVYEYDDTTVKGKINALQSGVVFTSIPFDKGWKLTVDGQQQEIIPIANDGLIGIEMLSGEHEIVLKYTPQGFKIGCIISAVSLALFVLYSIAVKKKETVA